MSRKVKAAAIQMRCSNNVGDNIKKADEMTREAVKKGANIILLPELFERQYFCQREDMNITPMPKAYKKMMLSSILHRLLRNLELL